MEFLALSDPRNRDASRPPAWLAWHGTARRRPAPRRLAVEALDPRIVPTSLMVSDVMVIEGNAGIQYAEVVVTLDAPSNRTVTVSYGTANGTALVGSDYQAVSGKLSFAPGQTSKAIQVPIIDDRISEPDETFSVKLKGAKGAKISDGTGVVTVLDDEPRINISDASVWEGNSGTTLMTFTVSLPAAHDQVVTVDFATQDGTASAGEDYLATSGTLTFAPGETTRTITVEIFGDTTIESDEYFFVNLFGASTNALVVDGQSYGVIIDDDAPPYQGDCNDNPYGCQ